MEKPGTAVAILPDRVEEKRETKSENGNRNKQVLKKEKVMKKVFATILAVALVAAIPATVSASGFQNCNQHGILTPCRAPMPPSGHTARLTSGG